MSLMMQLLTVGRSLKPFKDKPSPFTMKQPILLPKFGPKADQEPGERAQGAAPEDELLEQAAKPVDDERSVRGWRLLRTTAAKKVFVQTELSLEAVRVVRNDLQESGAAQRSGANPFKSRDSKQTVTVMSDWWTRLQRRLFVRARKQD